MIKKVLDLINNLSLLWTFGSAVCLYFFSKVVNVYHNWEIYFLLSGIIWILYTLDHILDAKRVVNENVKRYNFHKRYKNTLLILIGLLTPVLIYAIFLLDQKLVLFGTALGLLCLLYLKFNQEVKFVKKYKELFAAALITIGVFLPIWLSISVSRVDVLLFIMVSFFIICVNNLNLFSRFTMHADIKENLDSRISTASEEKFNGIMNRWFIIGILPNVMLLYAKCFDYFAVLSLMQLVLLIMFLDMDKFSHNERYRFYGDAIFLAPILILAIG